MSTHKILRVGDVFENTSGCRYKVIDYKGATEVTVKFDDVAGFEVKNSASNIRAGSVKNPYHPTVYGVGYIGSGKYKSKVNDENTLAYSTWMGMFIRCYRKKVKKSDVSYIGCTVAPEWHDFQVFAEWYVNHESYGLGYHLDKDLLKTGNRVYSPDSCCLVPVIINSAITNSAPSKTGLPVGVNPCRSGKGFRVRLSENGKSRHVGKFETIGSAKAAYIIEKDNYIRSLATEWRANIAANVYDSLMCWSAK